jgi:ABC-2 type transport system permease protein
MADIESHPDLRVLAVSAAPFSRLAFRQYRALVRMRAAIFANSMRTGAGAIEFGARAVSFVIYAFMGIGLGVGAGTVAYSLAANHELQFLGVEFWSLFALWQIISIVLASFSEQFDMSSLLRFPINFSSFFLLHLIFGLVDASTIAGSLGCGGILIGVALAQPALVPATALALVGFAAFNIFLVRAIFAWLDRWLAKRRSREIVSAVFLISLVGLQLLNPLVRNNDWPAHPRHRAHGAPGRPMPDKFEPLRRSALAAQAWLPPGLAAIAVADSERRNTPAQARSLGMLGLYVLGAAGLLGLRLRSEYRGENLGEAPHRSESVTREKPWLLSGNGPIGAMIEKEMITLSRSMMQIYSICVPPIMVLVIASLFRNSATLGSPSFHLALPVCVAYGMLGFTQLIYNSLGSEGTGISMLFLFPVPVRTVLLAKNLFHGTLYLIAAVISGIVTRLRLGPPDAVTLAVTIAWLAFALPANLAAGNVLSITMAYRVNLGRLGRQAGSQANALLSMLIQTTILGVGAGAMSLCMLFDRLWLAVPVLSALAVVSVSCWLLVLRNADAMANRRRVGLLGRLART